MITIIVPVYARTAADLEYLDRCLAASVAQAPVVVWDDGSPIDVEPIARKYPVHLGRAPHRGKSFARNSAADLAQTPLILPLDADDWPAPNAVERMAREWRGVPLYSWVFKWYNEARITEHRCQDFSCDHLAHECISSVNVLHSKEQWAAVGGWDERINLFEDWLYNAKLMWLFGGQLIPRALFYYRQHAGQSTNYYRTIEGKTREFVRAEIASFGKENQDMACCGKRRKNETPTLAARSAPGVRAAPPARSSPRVTLSAASSGQALVSPERYGSRSELPAENSGRIVSARYIGNPGAGPHYYRDPDTRHAYKVRHGVSVQADITDTCSQEDHDQGRSRKLLIRIVTPPPPPPPPVVVAPVAPARKLTLADLVVQDLIPMPESLRELRDLVSAGQTEEQLRVWFDEESEREKPRIGAIKLLEKALNG